MAGEADTQLDIKPKEGLHFFTFTVRDVLGRELPGQMEATSEGSVCRFLGDQGYEVVEIRQGWYAMQMNQSQSDRTAAVEERLRDRIESILTKAAQHHAESVRVRLDGKNGRVIFEELLACSWSELSQTPPDLYPALRDKLAEMAGLALPKYEARYDCSLALNIGGVDREVQVTLAGNTIELRGAAG